jgi:ribosomal-protein-alanine N-acetyltransferase
MLGRLSERFMQNQQHNNDMEMTLKTPRLYLRAIEESDAENIHTALSIRQISDAMISIPYPFSTEESKRYIAQKNHDQEGGLACVFVIERASDNNFCGLIEVREIDQEHAQAELSFWLAIEAWGNGYMGEVVPEVVNYCFRKLELNRLYGYHMIRNPASGRTLEKSGFTKEGVLRQRVQKLGVFEDVALWAILQADVSSTYGEELHNKAIQSEQRKKRAVR